MERRSQQSRSDKGQQGKPVLSVRLTKVTLCDRRGMLPRRVVDRFVDRPVT